MAIERGTGASTAYATQRYAPRPAAGKAVVGQLMSAKQRDFLTSLVTDKFRADAAGIRLLTPVQGKYSAADIEALAAEIDAPAKIVEHVQAQLNRTNITARALIDSWITARDAARRMLTTKRAAAPRVAAAAAPVSVEDGQTYRAPDGRTFHVYQGQAGHLLAKLWNAADDAFGYFGAANRLPAGLVQLTTEELQAFGRATGTCAVCMRHLTDDESVARGIGPVCYSRM